MGRERKKLLSVHARLFPDDVQKLKRIAKQKMIPWGTELRLLVRRALDVALVEHERSGE